MILGCFRSLVFGYCPGGSKPQIEIDGIRGLRNSRWFFSSRIDFEPATLAATRNRLGCSVIVRAGPVFQHRCAARPEWSERLCQERRDR